MLLFSIVLLLAMVAQVEIFATQTMISELLESRTLRERDRVREGRERREERERGTSKTREREREKETKRTEKTS